MSFDDRTADGTGCAWALVIFSVSSWWWKARDSRALTLFYTLLFKNALKFSRSPYQSEALRLLAELEVEGLNTVAPSLALTPSISFALSRGALLLRAKLCRLSCVPKLRLTCFCFILQVTMFSELCADKFAVEPVEVQDASGSVRLYPDLAEYVVATEVDYVNRYIGLQLQPEQVKQHHTRLQLRPAYLVRCRGQEAASTGWWRKRGVETWDSAAVCLYRLLLWCNPKRWFDKFSGREAGTPFSILLALRVTRLPL